MRNIADSLVAGSVLAWEHKRLEENTSSCLSEPHDKQQRNTSNHVMIRIISPATLDRFPLN